MKYQKDGNVITVRLNIGEDIITSLAELCKRENIAFARVSGLGAVSRAKFGFFKLNEGEYLEKTIEEPMEMVSLTGNITRKENEPYLHLHAAFTGEDCRGVGGHLLEAIIGVTAEIFVFIIDGKMNRRTCPETGVNILDI